MVKLYNPTELDLVVTHAEHGTIHLPAREEIDVENEALADHAAKQLEGHGVVKLTGDEHLDAQAREWAEIQAHRHAQDAVRSFKRHSMFDKVEPTLPSIHKAQEHLRRESKEARRK